MSYVRHLHILYYPVHIEEFSCVFKDIPSKDIQSMNKANADASVNMYAGDLE